MSPNRDQRSRRAILAGAAAGVAAIAAGSLARPLPVRAGADGDVVLGDVNESVLTTTLRNTSGPEPVPETVLRAVSLYGPAIDAVSTTEVAITAASDSGMAVHARSHAGTAIEGEAEGDDPYSAVGVRGRSTKCTGVEGSSGVGWGVTGSSEGTEFGHAGGVFGMSDRTVGVFGLSAQGIAVEGRSDHDPAKGIGVKGFSKHGDGVVGESETSIGVFGAGQWGVHGLSGSPGGIGVYAKSETGPALHAIAVYPDQGARAIIAEGPVEFSSAGRGKIALGATRATVTSPVALDGAVSKILVTLLANPAGKMASSLSHVVIHQLRQAFTVVLTAPAAREVPFAYFVLD